MLALLRGETAPTNPLHWDLPGGILEYGESLETCVERETREEAGITVDLLRAFHAVSRMNSIGEFWTTVFFAGRAVPQEVTISWEHIEYRWVLPEEFIELTVPLRQRETVEKFIEFRDQGKI